MAWYIGALVVVWAGLLLASRMLGPEPDPPGAQAEPVALDMRSQDTFQFAPPPAGEEEEKMTRTNTATPTNVVVSPELIKELHRSGMYDIIRAAHQEVVREATLPAGGEPPASVAPAQGSLGPDELLAF